MNFTQTVKQRMVEQNIKACTLARKTGYCPQYISELLGGEKRWNETTIDKVCEVLGLKVEFVINDDSIEEVKNK
jgi:plasmid maintenance system antidote protein VapI